MQVNKSIKIFINYFLGPLLFAWLGFSIYKHIKNQPQLQVSWKQIQNSFHSAQVFYLLAAILLMLLNWGIEARKWQRSVAMIHRVDLIQAFKAVMSGVTFSVIMPNRVGEYIGRILYLPEGARLKTISVTLVGSFAQFLTTVLAGIIGLAVLKPRLLSMNTQISAWYPFLLYGLIALAVVLLLVYFNVNGAVFLFKRWIKHQKHLYLVEALHVFHKKLLLEILVLSFLRYITFLIQYILIFNLFEVDVSAVVVAWVMSVVFLVLAVIPSIALVEVGVRGEVSLKLMEMFSTNSLGIGLTIFTIWLLNLILPAIAGSLLLLNIKAFAKKNQKAYSHDYNTSSNVN